MLKRGQITFKRTKLRPVLAKKMGVSRGPFFLKMARKKKSPST